jgi:leader peptidase (prepilin peptidase) / N-methyltransferase
MIGALLAAILGFFVGVGVNVLADTMPTYRRPRPPEYPDFSPRPWSGTLTFLTGKRTSATGSKLPWRHVIVEIGTALFFAWVALSPGEDETLLTLMVWFIYLAILILITVIDAETRLIMFPVIIPSLAIVLPLSLLTTPTELEFWQYPLGALIGGGLFYLMFLGGVLFSKWMERRHGEPLEEVAFGFGDVMLGTLSGLMIGSVMIGRVVFYAILAAGVAAVLYAGFMKLQGRFNAFSAIAYGPYIALCTAIALIIS